MKKMWVIAIGAMVGLMGSHAWGMSSITETICRMRSDGVTEKDIEAYVREASKALTRKPQKMSPQELLQMALKHRFDEDISGGMNEGAVYGVQDIEGNFFDFWGFHSKNRLVIWLETKPEPVRHRCVVQIDPNSTEADIHNVTLFYAIDSISIEDAEQKIDTTIQIPNSLLQNFTNEKLISCSNRNKNESVNQDAVGEEDPRITLKKILNAIFPQIKQKIEKQCGGKLAPFFSPKKKEPSKTPTPKENPADPKSSLKQSFFERHRTKIITLGMVTVAAAVSALGYYVLGKSDSGARVTVE